MTADIYHIIAVEEERVELKLAGENHPLFRAHFPGNPILPGFAQIEIIAKIRQDEVVRVSHGKFISHLFPNDTIIYHIRQEDGITKIKVTRDGKKVSEIRYEAR